MTVSLRGLAAALHKPNTSGRKVASGAHVQMSDFLMDKVCDMSWLNVVGEDVTTETNSVEEADVIIDRSLLPQFAQEFTDSVQVWYAEECENEDDPPVSAIFEVAHNVNLTALINGQHETYWTPRKIAKAAKDGLFDQPLSVELLRNKVKFIQFTMAWTDASTVALLQVSH